jgi:hypothetical protein
VSGVDDEWRVAAIRQGRFDISTSGVDTVGGATTEITIVLSRK